MTSGAAGTEGFICSVFNLLQQRKALSENTNKKKIIIEGAKPTF